MDTGIVYPEITLGGVEYEVKLTQGLLCYRLGRLGTDMNGLFTERNLASFSKLVDVLHAAISDVYKGKPEDLAELVMSEQKQVELGRVVFEALGKVFPLSGSAATAGHSAPKPN